MPLSFNRRNEVLAGEQAWPDTGWQAEGKLAAAGKKENSQTANNSTANGNNLLLTMSACNGTLVLSGANTYAGGTVVNEGNLVSSSTSAIPAGGSIQINFPGAVNISGAYTTASSWIGSGTITPNSTGALREAPSAVLPRPSPSRGPWSCWWLATSA